MANLGPRDTKDLVLLTGWDATELKKHQLQDGTTFATLVGDMNAALGAVNAELYNDPLWSSIASYQDMPEVEYRVGSSNGFKRFTEYGQADAQRGDTEGHMLPLVPFDRKLGWTWNYLRKARRSQLDADIQDAIKDIRDLYRVQLLTRVLKRGDDSGEYYGLGSSGYSTGFATAAASTAVDYTPPAFGGTSFTSDHEHYVGIAGGAFTAAVFTDANSELKEHGHNPPYDFWIGGSDEATVKGLTGFVGTASSLIAYNDTAALANFGGGNQVDMNGSYYIGTISDFRVRVVPGIPQYYGFGFKSYGANSQRNPVRIRLQKGIMRPAVVAMPDPRAGNGAYPLQFMMLFTEFGVGVADRTNGTARYVNNATWADGTPT